MGTSDRLYHFMIDWLLSEKTVERALSDFERLRRELEPGDVLLIDGYTRLDSRIKDVTSSRWSRVMVYIGRLHDIQDPSLRATLLEFLPCEPNTQLLVEYQIDRGVVLVPLSSIELEHIRICRPVNLRAEDQQQVIRYCISRVGKQAEKSWLELARLVLIPWGLLARRWRIPLMSRIAGAVLNPLLGSLVAEAYAFVQYPVLPLTKHRDENGMVRIFRREPKVTYAMDFDHSPYFSIIKYPYITESSRQDGQMLPWKGDTEQMGETRHEHLSIVPNPATGETKETSQQEQG